MVDIYTLPAHHSDVTSAAWREAHKKMSFAISKANEWEQYSRVSYLKPDQIHHAESQMHYHNARAERIKKALVKFHTDGTEFANREIMWL